jgi:drug/metabolite transporter (DMT)-like permease
LPTSALLLTLAAAVIHASWNLLLSAEEDTHSATAAAIAIGVVLFAPVAAIDWRVEPSALPYIAASSALEVLYLILLATGYSVAAMGFVYPIARGSAPVLVLAVSALALGASVSGAAVAGVALVATGIMLVRGLRASARRRDLALALGVGACIAGYTLVDKRGVAHAAPIAYLELVFAVTGTAYVLGVWRAQGGAAIRRAVSVTTLLAGTGFFASYALTLAALRIASAASVAAVRESSVVIATAALAISGRERVTAQRLVGAVAVVAGIALISLPP